MAAYITIGAPTEDGSNDILGTQDLHRQRIRLTVQGNQTASQTGACSPTTLLRGSALGLISASGKAILLNSQATDGSQTLVAILAHDLETSGGDQIALAYVTGSFLADRLLFGGSDVVASHFNRFTGRGIAAPSIFAEPSTSYPDSPWS